MYILRNVLNTPGDAVSRSPTPASVPPAAHEPAAPAAADPRAHGLERSGSLVSTTPRAPSFVEDTVEGRVAASMVAADTSAALMVSARPTAASLAPKEIARAPPTSLHRGDTLDRGMDVLASQDLSIAPEAAVCARARKREQDLVSQNMFLILKYVFRWVRITLKSGIVFNIFLI